MMSWSPLTRRSVALGLVIVPVLFVLLYIFLPFMEHYQANEEQIKHKRFVLTRFEAIKLYKPETNTIDKIELQKQKANFITDTTEAIAGAALQSKLKRLAAQNRVTVLRANKLANRKEGELSLVGVRLELIGTQKALQSVLQKIENSRPYLFIEKLELKTSHTSQRNQDLKLTARLHVYGAFEKRGRK